VAFRFLASERLKRETADKLALHALAAQGDPKRIKSTLAGLKK
jgi:hypothetical protein